MTSAASSTITAITQFFYYTEALQYLQKYTEYNFVIKKEN
jgi:hypothetical protein